MAKKKSKKKSSKKEKAIKTSAGKETASQTVARVKAAMSGSSSSSTSKNTSSSTSKSTSKTKTSAGYETSQETIDRISKAMSGGKPEAPKEEKTKKEKAEDGGTFDPEAFKKTAEYQSLPPDLQDAALAVYSTIADNDQVAAGRLIKAFQTASGLATPFFKQQLRLAKDELERGFVEIGKEKEFKHGQLQKRLADLRTDISAKKDFLTLEETSSLKEIERAYDSQIKDVRQDLAATGMTSSLRRAETETLLNETTGDLRESTRRRFGTQLSDLDRGLAQEEGNTQSEIERLTEVAKSSQLDLFRSGEKLLGSNNLPQLGGMNAMGGINGTLEQDFTDDLIKATSNLIF